MVNDKGERFEDNVVPQAIPAIQAREDATIPVGELMGFVPTSIKPGVDDAVYGVATWERWDPAADRLSTIMDYATPTERCHFRSAESRQ